MPKTSSKTTARLPALILGCLISVGAASQVKDSCDLPVLPDIHFKASVFLNVGAMAALDSAIKIIKQHPACNIIVAGNTENCEICQQVAWDRVFSVIEYMKKRGIDSTKLIFAYSNEGEPRLVQLQATSYDGPNIVPAPHPCYSYHKLTKHRCHDLDGHQRPKL